VTEAPGADPVQHPSSSVEPWAPPDRCRALQLVLAGLWFLDAVLQLQPFMFTKSFGLLMLGPTAAGNPGLLAHPITDVSRSIGHHSVGADTAFVVVQFVIAFGIAYRPTVRVALAGSIVWSVLVWWLGEGLGRVLTGAASPLTGSPGAVVLYGVLAVLLWSADRPGPAPFPAARAVGANAAKAIWIAIWAALAATALFGSATRHPRSLLSSMIAGEPGWLASLDRHAANLVAGHGPGLAVAAAAVFGCIAAGVLAPPNVSRAVIAVAAVVAVAVWVVGENLGQLFSGSATDPNTGPILLLLAAAYWPLRQGAPATVTRAV
jgi:hypothetical protein